MLGPPKGPFYFYIKKLIMWYRLNKWFELNWGWFFINGRKQDAWAEYLRKKYGNTK